jgi:hypothetical protein
MQHEILVECHRDEADRTVARVIIFEVDAAGCKTIADIAETTVIGDPQHCYNLDYLARTLCRRHDLTGASYINSLEVPFGKASSPQVLMRRATKWHAEHFNKNGTTYHNPPPPYNAETEFNNRYISDAEWALVLADREKRGV